MKGRYGAGYSPRPLKRKEVGEILKKAREWARKHPALGYRKPKT